MDSYLSRLFFSLGLILIGASGWIALERFEAVPPMCLVDGRTYDQLSTRK